MAKNGIIPIVKKDNLTIKGSKYGTSKTNFDVALAIIGSVPESNTQQYLYAVMVASVIRGITKDAPLRRLPNELISKAITIMITAFMNGIKNKLNMLNKTISAKMKRLYFIAERDKRTRKATNNPGVATESIITRALNGPDT